MADHLQWRHPRTFNEFGTVARQISGSQRSIYLHCSACHGLHGEGGPGGAVAGTTLARSQIISVTTEGTSGMPGYGSQLSGIEIEAVADHILGMSGAPSNPEGTAAGENGTADTAVPPELAYARTYVTAAWTAFTPTLAERDEYPFDSRFANPAVMAPSAHAWLP